MMTGGGANCPYRRGPDRDCSDTPFTFQLEARARSRQGPLHKKASSRQELARSHPCPLLSTPGPIISADRSYLVPWRILAVLMAQEVPTPKRRRYRSRPKEAPHPPDAPGPSSSGAALALPSSLLDHLPKVAVGPLPSCAAGPSSSPFPGKSKKLGGGGAPVSARRLHQAASWKP